MRNKIPNEANKADIFKLTEEIFHIRKERMRIQVSANTEPVSLETELKTYPRFKDYNGEVVSNDDYLRN